MNPLPDSNQMRAAVLHGRGDLRIQQVPVPQIEEGEVLLRIRAALTCGTDLKVYRRGYHAKMLKPPMLFGHECAGEIVETRSQLFQKGDRVVVANSAPCGGCYFCERDQENLCDDLHFLNGAYAEFLRVPARFVSKNTHIIPKHLSFEEAAMTEPLACVVYGLEVTPMKKGERVAVIGLGPIGLMFVNLLKDRGVEVVGIGRHESRLDLAGRLGCDEVVDIDHEPDWMTVVPQRGRLDGVIEATGRPEIWKIAIEMVRKGGVVNLFGGCPAGTQIELDTTRMHYDQMTLKSPFHHRPQAIRQALEYLSKGVVKAKDFITDRRLLKDLPAVFEEMVQAKKSVKTCILTDDWNAEI